MRYSSLIRNQKALEWELSLQEAYLFSWMYELPSWAEKVVIGNDVYYFASKNKAIEEMPLLTTKADTMYRYYKSLEAKDLILIKKIDGKDYISLTQKSKTWNFQSDYSENNPTSLGNKSEYYSENNPTYNNTTFNKVIKDTTTTKEKIEVVEVPDFVKKEQEEKRKIAEEYTAGKFDEEETKESLYKDSKTQMAFKRLIAQDEKLSNLETTEEAFRHCFKTLIDETVFNASMKDDFPRSLVKSREHFLNFSRMIVSDKPERIKKLLIPR